MHARENNWPAGTNVVIRNVCRLKTLDEERDLSQPSCSISEAIQVASSIGETPGYSHAIHFRVHQVNNGHRNYRYNGNAVDCSRTLCPKITDTVDSRDATGMLSN
jgi:hypothetical protein